MSKELFDAAKTDDVILAKQALVKLPNIDIFNDQGETPLIIAVKNKSKRVTEFLLTSAANVHLTDHLSRTALHWAVIIKDKEIIRLLLDYNAQTDVLDIDKKSPLTIASESQEKDLQKIFEEFEIANYHADRLALRRDVESLVGEHDIVNEVYLKLKSHIPFIADMKLKQKFIDISQQLYQPEELLGFLRVPTSPLGESKALIEKKPEKEIKQESGFHERITGFSKEFIKVESLPLEEYLHADLTPSSPIFKKVYRFISFMDELCEELKSLAEPTYHPFISLFGKLKQFYLDYINEICLYKEDKRHELLIGRIRVRGFLGSRYMRPGAALRFKTFFDHTASADRDNKHGLHSVVELLGVFYKIRPAAPGIESMVDILNKIISGQGSAPTELLIIEKGAQLFPVLASKAVYGQNFLDLLMEHPEYIQLIDSFNYSTHVVMTLLTKPQDAKFDNFIALLEMNPQNNKVIRIKIVGIDNDLSFKDVILTNSKKSMFAGKHYVYMKSCFLLLPQMNQSIDPLFAQLFLKQSPELIILKWLKALLLQEEAYLAYKNLAAVDSDFENPLRQYRTSLLGEEFNKIKLPIRLLPDTLLHVYRTIHVIQRVIKRNPHLTHHQLLMEVESNLAHYYQYLRETKFKKVEYEDIVSGQKVIKEYPEIIVRQINLYEAPILENTLKQVALDLSAYTRTERELEDKSTETLIESCEKFINSLDYGKLGNDYLERELLEKVSTEFPFIKQVTIRNSKALTDHSLEFISQHLKNLELLTLINCPNVKGSGLSALLCQLTEICLQIEDMSQLSVTCLLDLLQHQYPVTLVIAGKSYYLKSDQLNLLTDVLAHEKHRNLILALLMRGVHLSKGNVATPLHLATKAGLPEVVNELIRYGAPVDSGTLDEANKTALDFALENCMKEQDDVKRNRHEHIILDLISAGALTCKQPEKVLVILLKSLTDKFLAQSFLFKALFNFAHCHNLLDANLVSTLIPSGLKILDFSASKHMPRAKYHVKLDVIQALKFRLPGLEHLDITGCAGLTINTLKEILTWGLTSLSMSYEQLEGCKLIELSKINTIGNLKLADSLLEYKHITQAEYSKISKKTEIRVTELILNMKKLTPPILNELQILLSQTQYLNHLELCSCGITAEYLRILCKGFRQNTSVQVLLLARNPLKEEGVNILLELLKDETSPGLRNLKKLSLEEVQATHSAGVLIAEILQRHGTLEFISLCRNTGVGDEGVIALAEGIQKKLQSQKVGGNLLSLKYLDVNEVGMGDKGVTALARALIFHRNMVFLDIGHNSKISNVGFLALIELLQLNTSIQKIKGYKLGSHEGFEADSKLISQFELLIQEREHGLQLAKLERIAKSNQAQWQRHVPEILSKPEEDKANKAQIESMHKRIEELEKEVKQLKLSQLEGPQVEEVSSLSSEASTKFSKGLVIGSKRESAPAMRGRGADGGLFDARVTIKAALINLYRELVEHKYSFCYYSQENNLRIEILAKPEKEERKLSSFWEYIVKTIQNFDSSQKIEEKDGISLKELSEDQHGQIVVLLKELGIVALDSVVPINKDSPTLVSAPKQ